MQPVEIAFWFSFFMIFYAYAGYPALLWIVSLFVKRTKTTKSNDVTAKKILPTVSLLISAYNEESVIEEKIINSLLLNYPKKLLEILVLSDGSTDRTDEIVKNFDEKGIQLLRYEGRQGKTSCLNKAAAQAHGDILIFSDANSRYDPEAVKNLVVNFSQGVGFVTGFTRYRFRKDEGFSGGIGLYGQIEKFTKKLESTFGVCVGADGAIFAIRKELYNPLQAADINDFVIPLSIIRRGFKGVLTEDAYCSEVTADEAKGEFNRQVRITTRTLRAILNNHDLLNPIKFPFFSFALLSHKVAKLSVPFFLLLLICSALLLSNVGMILALFSFVCLFGVPLILILYGRNDTNALSRFGSLTIAFASINVAIFIGWLKFIKGETFTTWAPTQR